MCRHLSVYFIYYFYLKSISLAVTSYTFTHSLICWTPFLITGLLCCCYVDSGIKQVSDGKHVYFNYHARTHARTHTPRTFSRLSVKNIPSSCYYTNLLQNHNVLSENDAVVLFITNSAEPETRGPSAGSVCACLSQALWIRVRDKHKVNLALCSASTHTEYTDGLAQTLHHWTNCFPVIKMRMK